MRNFTAKVVDSKNRAYIENAIQDRCTNPRKIWPHLKNMDIGKSENKISRPLYKPNEFNNFFFIFWFSVNTFLQFNRFYYLLLLCQCASMLETLTNPPD